MINIAPLILFVYNRPIHTSRTIRALEKCKLANKTDLIIFSDAATKDNDIKNVNEVRRLIKEVSGFKSLQIIEADQNKGLAKSIIEGVTSVMNKYDKSIVLEDDCIASPHFISFMNNALNFFATNPKVGSISGYSPPIHTPSEYIHDIYIIPRNCSMSWATWKDRWQEIDWQCSDFYENYFNLSFAKKINQAGSDRFLRLHRQLQSDKQSWSIKFGYSQFIRGYYTIYPKSSYILNIGCDGSGTHKEEPGLLDIELGRALSNPWLEDIEPNDRIINSFYNFYSGSFAGRLKRYFLSVIEIMKYNIKK